MTIHDDVRFARTTARLAAGCAALLFATAAIASDSAETIEINPAKDNTLIEIEDGSLSLGVATAFYAGRVGNMGGGTRRRGVLAFDVAAAVPAGATIVEASLQLEAGASPVGARPVSLRRMLADWGEEDSYGDGGIGGAALPGDATWLHRFYPDQFWATPGGDVSDVITATTMVVSYEICVWESNSQLIADVQDWLDDPASNFGWMVQGDEREIQTAKQFFSRESLPAKRPVLTIVYDAPSRTGDLTGDGTVDGADLAILLGAWGPCSDCDDCPADLDGSCTVDGADLAILLGNWR